MICLFHICYLDRGSNPGLLSLFVAQEVRPVSSVHLNKYVFIQNFDDTLLLLPTTQRMMKKHKTVSI